MAQFVYRVGSPVTQLHCPLRFSSAKPIQNTCASVMVLGRSCTNLYSSGDVIVAKWPPFSAQYFLAAGQGILVS